MGITPLLALFLFKKKKLYGFRYEGLITMNDKIIHVRLENSNYKITISVDGAYILISNLTVPNSFGFNRFDFFKESKNVKIKNAYDKQDWDKFIFELIERGYLLYYI